MTWSKGSTKLNQGRGSNVRMTGGITGGFVGGGGSVGGGALGGFVAAGAGREVGSVCSLGCFVLVGGTNVGEGEAVRVCDGEGVGEEVRVKVGVDVFVIVADGVADGGTVGVCVDVAVTVFGSTKSGS